MTGTANENLVSHLRSQFAVHADTRSFTFLQESGRNLVEEVTTFRELDRSAREVAAWLGSRPEAEAQSSQLVQWLRTALGDLSPRAAEMFTLRYVEELDNREIASLMNASQAVVAVTLHQTRAKLKKRLTEMERGNR